VKNFSNSISKSNFSPVAKTTETEDQITGDTFTKRKVKGPPPLIDVFARYPDPPLSRRPAHLRQVPSPRHNFYSPNNNHERKESK
jgi:hypothetical protein